MSKILNQNRKVKLNRQENNDKENKVVTMTAQKGSATMVVSVLPNGDILVEDYSQKDDRRNLVHHLEKLGVNTETIFDSFCG